MIEMMKEKARTGDAGAMMNLAMSMLDSDPSEARNLFRRAGKKGLKEGCWAAGFCFMLGIGGEKNMERVWEWFQRGSNSFDIYGVSNMLIPCSFIPSSLHFNGLFSFSSNKTLFFKHHFNLLLFENRMKLKLKTN